MVILIFRKIFGRIKLEKSLRLIMIILLNRWSNTSKKAWTTKKRKVR